MDKVSSILKQHGLRKTAIRRQVLEQFLSVEHRAISQPDLQSALPDADYVTLYRVLSSFAEKGIIHQIVDSSQATKYALCHSECAEHDHHDDHAHFHCQSCGKTICLDGTVESKVRLPQGFSVRQTHLVLEGHCDHCE